MDRSATSDRNSHSGPVPDTSAFVEAATSCVRHLGLVVESAAVLRATNNTVVRFFPQPIVAKMSTGPYNRLAEEIEIARLLVAAGAPIVRPAEGIPTAVHREGASR